MTSPKPPRKQRWPELWMCSGETMHLLLPNDYLEYFREYEWHGVGVEGLNLRDNWMVWPRFTFIAEIKP